MAISLYNHESLKDRRRFLRKNQTSAENIIWENVRGKRLDAYKFLRQYSVGPYILDFYCSKLRLAIEVDGSHHGEEDGLVYDKERERFLLDNKILTVRFWNDKVINDLRGVLEELKNTIKNRALDPSLVIREGPSEAKEG